MENHPMNLQVAQVALLPAQVQCDILFLIFTQTRGLLLVYQLLSFRWVSAELLISGGSLGSTCI